MMNQKNWKELIKNPNRENFNHYQNVELFKLLEKKEPNFILLNYNMEPGFVYHIPNVLSLKEVDKINANEKEFIFKPVGESGNANQYKDDDIISSYRSSYYDIKFAEEMFNRGKDLLPEFQSFAKNDYSVEHHHKEYEIIGFNPYNRMVKYAEDGKLVNHYDGHYYFDNQFQTLMTCLIYLTDNETGKTLFLKDNQKNVAIKERKVSNEDEVLLAIKPRKGDMLLFNQYLLHTTSELKNESKKLILTDLIACGLS